MRHTLRISGEHYAQLQSHLFPGDGLEAAALVLCGRRNGDDCHVFCARRVELIPYEACQRTPGSLDWPTRFADPLIVDAMKHGMAVIKIHSHPGGLEAFSVRDDRSDESFLGSVCRLLEDNRPHASAVMLPNGRIFARALAPDGKRQSIEVVSIAGDDLHFWFAESGSSGVPEFMRRHAQAFGAGTTEVLRRLTVAVIGCSGTGSPVVEQLVRLGVGCILLVDPDNMEWKNLNRIYMSKAADANLTRSKVHMLAEAIGNMGLATRVVPLAMDLESTIAVKAVAEADVVMGCMDSWYGRDLLNRLTTFYVQPYIDLGVQLTSLPQGGIDTIWGAVHYLQPGRSTLKSRGVYTSEDVRAELLRRDDPAEYKRRLREKYIRGVHEDRLAVISVNTQVAGMAVNELLARIHCYRLPPNGDFASQRIALHEGFLFQEKESMLLPCAVLGKELGRGDVVPLLDKPELTGG